MQVFADIITPDAVTDRNLLPRLFRDGAKLKILHSLEPLDRNFPKPETTLLGQVEIFAAVRLAAIPAEQSGKRHGFSHIFFRHGSHKPNDPTDNAAQKRIFLGRGGLPGTRIDLAKVLAPLFGHSLLTPFPDIRQFYAPLSHERARVPLDGDRKFLLPILELGLTGPGTDAADQQQKNHE